MTLLVRDLTAPPRAWTVYLVDPKFDREPELRNRLFVLLVYAMVETHEASGHRLHELFKSAKALSSKACLHYLEKIKFMVEAAADLASVFNLEEMVVIGDLRQEYVHGRRDALLKPKTEVRFFEKGKVTKKQLSAPIYRGIIAQQFGTKTTDQYLTFLRQRFTDAPTLYWSVYFLLELRWREIQVQLSEHDQFVAPVGDIIIGNSYAETKATAIANGAPMTLRHTRDAIVFEPTNLDPVFAMGAADNITRSPSRWSVRVRRAIGARLARLMDRLSR